MSRKIGSKNKPKYIVTTLKELNKVFAAEASIRVDAAYAAIIAAGEPTDLSELGPQTIKKMSMPRKEEKIAVRKVA